MLILTLGPVILSIQVSVVVTTVRMIVSRYVGGRVEGAHIVVGA